MRSRSRRPAGVGDPQVEAAFAAVAREDFLGPGPWHIVRWGGGYRVMPDADPIYLYTDDVIGNLPKRNLNNGQPPRLRSLAEFVKPRSPPGLFALAAWVAPARAQIHRGQSPLCLLGQRSRSLGRIGIGRAKIADESGIRSEE